MTDKQDNYFQAFQAQHEGIRRDALFKLAFDWRQQANLIYSGYIALENQCVHGNAVNQHLIKLLTEHKITFDINNPEIIENVIKVHEEGSQTYLNALKENGRLSVKEVARNHAYKTHQNHPATLALKKIEEHYSKEMEKFATHGHGANFVRKMAEKYPEIKEVKSIESLVAKLNKTNPHKPKKQKS